MTRNPTAPTAAEAWGSLILRLAAMALDAWLLMLLFGVLHGEHAAVPTFGYWQCVLAVLVVNLLILHGNREVVDRTKKVGSLVVAQRTKSAAPDAWRGIKGDQWS